MGDDETHSTWRKGMCGTCPAGCWVEVQIEQGRLTDIRADSDHPLGMLCRRGEAAPEIVYSDDRLRQPMRRIGPRGAGEFEPISWDDAYDLIVDNLRGIRERLGAEAVSIYTGRGAFELSLCQIFQPAGVEISSASSVLFPFGSPNTMGVGALCYVAANMIAPDVTLGQMHHQMFADIEQAQFLVVWGTNPATDSPPLDMHRLQNAADRGASVVVIDPRRTETVERTGAEWIPIRPGTDGALALSMIEVLIDEQLCDFEFIDQWCEGFEELREYVQHFRPEVAAEITGVDAETIRRIARRIGRVAGACPLMYTGLEYSNSGVQSMRAIYTLFALAGQLDVPGGIGLAMPGSQFPVNRSGHQPNPDIRRAVGRERFPLYSDYRAESHASALIDAVLDDEPYPIRGLIIQGASLLTSWPQPEVWREVLSSLEFLVCIDRQMTADAAYADVVLPATTMFEIDSYMVYGSLFRLREKLIEPVGQARNDYRIIAELADRLGYGELYPQTTEQMLRHVLDNTDYTLEQVREAGGTIRLDAPMMEHHKWKKGLLRADGKPGFDTPSGKFEIWSSRLEEYGYEPLPKYVEPREGPMAAPQLARRYPLVFNSGARPQHDFRSQHHGVDSLVEHQPEPVVEMNSGDAEQRGIETGDLVEVHTPRGTVPFRARVTDDIVPGAVECNMGGGTPVGPEAWQQWNVNELTDLDNYDPVSGFPVFKALLCEVTRLEEGDEQTRSSAVSSDEHRDWRPRLADEDEEYRQVYLDNNATTPLDPRVREAMVPWLEGPRGNPSSLHESGRRATQAIDEARRSVARLIGAVARDVIFTGGGTEADNLAIKGVASAARRRATGSHIITSQIEHPAVLNCCRYLECRGHRVTYLPVDGRGMVDPDDLHSALTDDTVLVSIMAANNEVGTVQPIARLGAIARTAGALFHTDAVQAVGKLRLDVEALNVDLLTLSAHKFHGPRGVGALYVRPDLCIEPVIHGGGQERGLRAGTENVPGVVGMGRAATLAQAELEEVGRIRRLRDRLEEGVRTLLPEVDLNGHRQFRLPNTLNITLPDIRGESLVIALDRRGISLSAGSACRSGSPEPTHVLMAMGRTDEQAHCSVRFSLSHHTGREDIDYTVDAIGELLQEQEQTVRFLVCK